eukprot:TRINITY_DN7857_c0_g3_i2.p1 TRINITY_DN7857_c0_g3~~TRINITY_DN7857_c0_g3_i2.p1  ORF type:complete len:335 (+),score=49.17 TRINITY_DN7857_c0_g3_i2:68-1072(+)
MLLLAGSVILVLLLLLLGRKKQYEGFSPDTPRPYELPILGSLIPFSRHIRNDTVLPYLDMLSKTLGNTYIITINISLRFIVTLEPANVRHFMYTNFNNYDKGDVMREIYGKLFGKGIFAADGHQWEVMRKTARPLFMSSIITQHMLPVFIKHGNKVLQKFENVKNIKGKIDLQDLFFRFTLDSIGEIGFGTDINSLNEEVRFSKSFDRVQTICTERFASHPLWKLNYFQTVEFNDNMKYLTDYVFKIIEKRKNGLESGDENLPETKDLLKMFMDIKDENDEPYSDDYLKDMLINFFIAGRDTTAMALTFSCYLLTTHPDKLAILQKELAEVFRR